MINHDANFIYIHIPKTGGTTITTIFDFEFIPSIPVNDPFNVDTVEQETETHLPAVLLYRSFPETFQSYFKACFVRNSWDYIVSAYLWLKKYYNLEHDFNTWIKLDFIGTPDRERTIFLNPCQLDWITDENGDVIVDFIGRFEKFEEDLQTIYQKLEIEPIPIPHENPTEHQHYSHYYNEESKERIMTLYKKDIQFFNFTFETEDVCL